MKHAVFARTQRRRTARGEKTKSNRDALEKAPDRKDSVGRPRLHALPTYGNIGIWGALGTLAPPPEVGSEPDDMPLSGDPPPALGSDGKAGRELDVRAPNGNAPKSDPMPDAGSPGNAEFELPNAETSTPSCADTFANGRPIALTPTPAFAVTPTSERANALVANVTSASVPTITIVDFLINSLTQASLRAIAR